MLQKGIRNGKRDEKGGAESRTNVLGKKSEESRLLEKEIDCGFIPNNIDIKLEV